MIVSALLIANYMGNDSTRTSVYTSNGAYGDTLYLFVDNEYVGELPQVDNHALKDIRSGKTLDLSLKHGTHLMTAKDRKGNEISTLKINVASFVTSSIGLTGGHRQSVEGLLNRRILVDMF